MLNKGERMKKKTECSKLILYEFEHTTKHVKAKFATRKRTGYE